MLQLSSYWSHVVHRILEVSQLELRCGKLLVRGRSVVASNALVVGREDRFVEQYAEGRAFDAADARCLARLLGDHSSAVSSVGADQHRVRGILCPGPAKGIAGEPVGIEQGRVSKMQDLISADPGLAGLCELEHVVVRLCNEWSRIWDLDSGLEAVSSHDSWVVRGRRGLLRSPCGSGGCPDRGALLFATRPTVPSGSVHSRRPGSEARAVIFEPPAVAVILSAAFELCVASSGSRDGRLEASEVFDLITNVHDGRAPDFRAFDDLGSCAVGVAGSNGVGRECGKLAWFDFGGLAAFDRYGSRVRAELIRGSGLRCGVVGDVPERILRVGSVGIRSVSSEGCTVSVRAVVENHGCMVGNFDGSCFLAWRFLRDEAVVLDVDQGEMEVFVPVLRPKYVPVESPRWFFREGIPWVG